MGRHLLGRRLIRYELVAVAMCPSPLSSSSADPRKRIADQLIHHPPAAKSRLHHHHPGRLGPDLADRRRLRAARHRRSAAAPRRRASGATKATSRPRSRRTSGRYRVARPPPATTGDTGTSASRTTIAHPRGPRQLVEHRGDPAARRVAHAVELGPAASSSASAAGHSELGIRLDLGVEVELVAREHDRRPVLADRAGDEIRSPGRIPAVRQLRARVDGSDPGRAEVHPVGERRARRPWCRRRRSRRRPAAARRRSPRPRPEARRRAGPPRGSSKGSARAAGHRPSRGR